MSFGSINDLYQNATELRSWGLTPWMFLLSYYWKKLRNSVAYRPKAFRCFLSIREGKGEAKMFEFVP